MDPGLSDIKVSDVILSLAGRDKGKLFYCVGVEDRYLLLSDGKGRPLERPKRKKRSHARKVLRSETRVAAKLQAGDKVLNSELRKDLAYWSRELESNDRGG